MRDLHKLPFNLQFFGEGDGEPSVNTQDVAEPAAEPTEPVTDGDGGNGEKEPQEPAEPVTPQTPEVNAQFAAARRKAEAEMRARDMKIANLCRDVVNPETGKPIQSVDDYIAALDAQQRMNTEQMLREKGIEPSVLDEAINRNPVVMQAMQVMEQQKQEEMDRQIANDIQAIGKLNPAIKSIDDLSKDESFVSVYERWQKSNFTESLYDIYRLVNFDKLTSQKADAAKQAAINQARGKNHMEPTSSGVNQNDNLQDIPESELAVWKEYYPNATMTELKQKYNATL